MINKVVLNSPTEPPTVEKLSYRILYGVLFLYLFIAVPSSTELICGILSRVRNQRHSLVPLTWACICTQNLSKTTSDSFTDELSGGATLVEYRGFSRGISK